jgi:sulfite exporter TauE/SafE
MRRRRGTSIDANQGRRAADAVSRSAMDLLHAAHAPLGLAPLCGVGGPLGLLGVALALGSVGLVGGFAHCAAMCGPFVLMQAAPGEGGLTLRRLALGAAPGYQLGRLTTYVALGAAMGALGGGVEALAPVRAIAALLLLLAALSFLLEALKLLRRGQRAPRSPGQGAVLARALAPLVAGERRLALGGYPLGLVLGLLPCGFLYAALLAAAATGGVIAGAVAMAGFALGTAPALACVGVLGAAAAGRWRGPAARLAAPILLVNALLLAGLAARLLA